MTTTATTTSKISKPDSVTVPEPASAAYGLTAWAKRAGKEATPSARLRALCTALDARLLAHARIGDVVARVVVDDPTAIAPTGYVARQISELFPGLFGSDADLADLAAAEGFLCAYADHVERIDRSEWPTPAAFLDVYAAAEPTSTATADAEEPALASDPGPRRRRADAKSLVGRRGTWICPETSAELRIRVLSAERGLATIADLDSPGEDYAGIPIGQLDLDGEPTGYDPPPLVRIPVANYDHLHALLTAVAPVPDVEPGGVVDDCAYEAFVSTSDKRTIVVRAELVNDEAGAYLDLFCGYPGGTEPIAVHAPIVGEDWCNRRYRLAAGKRLVWDVVFERG